MVIEYTEHGAMRVAERSRLTPSEIEEFIEHKSVLLGKEKSRIHYLFYSPIDIEYFVAIIDSKSGTFITLLPENYHENISWVISDQSKRLAYDVSISGSCSTKLPILDAVAEIKRDPDSAKYSVTLMVTYQNGTHKNVTVGKYDVNKYSDENDMLNSDEVSRDIEDVVNDLTNASDVRILVKIRKDVISIQECSWFKRRG